MSYDGLLFNTCALIRVDTNKWNQPTEVITSPNEPCRFEFGNRVAKTVKGEEVISTATVFFKVSVVINESYKVRYQGRDYDVVEVQRPQNSVALHHVEVLVK